MAKVRLASDLTLESFVDGDGLRMVVWFQGCKFNCEGCHNKKTQSFDGGSLVEVDDIISELKKYPYHQGVTISGGDPFEQREALLELVSKIKEESDLDIWVYTGYNYEDIKDECLEILKKIDVLVDGLFILAKRSLALKFIGSSNQRVIDIPKTLEHNKIEEYFN